MNWWLDWVIFPATTGALVGIMVTGIIIWIKGKD